MSSPAAGPWSKNFPAAPGIYLAFYVGDWFVGGPKNQNNRDVLLVHIVVHNGKLEPLTGGRFLERKEVRGWQWSKVTSP